MTNLLLQRGLWQLAKLNKLLGLVGGIGVALMLASCLVYLMNILALNQEIIHAKKTLGQAAFKQEMSLATKPSPVENTLTDIDLFKKSLPKTTSLHEWLGLIDQAAVKQKVLLNRGDYKFSMTKKSQISDGFDLSKYEIVLPVSGQYKQIRLFIAQVLHMQPALALSELKMMRESALSPNIEARLVFVLYLQSESK